MRKLNVTLAFLATAGALAFGCSSDTGDGTGGLSGGVTGKGGSSNPGQGGSGNGSSSGGSSTGGTGVIIGTGNTSGTTSAGTSSGGSAAESAGGACTGTTASGMKGKGAVVFFLVDTSLSMNDAPTTGGSTMFGGRGGGMPGGTSKLKSTQTALDQAFTTLSNGLQVGLAFFPNVPVNTTPCYMAQTAVPIALLDAPQVTALTAAVDAAVANGGTPTFDAYQYAVQTLQASTLMGDKYIVLITDGIPTYGEMCMGNGMPTQDPPIPMQPLIDASQNAFTADGIKTYVVGSPGSEMARATLSAMARVGGTGPAGCMDTGPTYCHFDMTTATDFGASLSAALGQIQMQIPVDCSFNLPKPPSGMQLDLNMINVTLTNDDGSKTPIGRDPNGDCATDGWVYVGDPPTAVQLCGSLCNSVKAQAMPAIDVQFGCSQRVNPPR